jgi:bile acid-coenzyme A ligase
VTQLDLEPKPFVRTLRQLAVAAPDAVAITCGDDEVTRAELEVRSNRLARPYESLGVGIGDFVTIGLPNSIDFYVATLATWKLGAVPQPVSYRLPPAELSAIIELAGSALVVGVDPGAIDGRPCLPVGFTPDDGFDDGPLREVVSPAAKAPTSGGSTGRPKLIVSGSPAAGPPGAGAMFGMQPGDVQLVPGPLYHNAPFGLSTSGLQMGHHLVVLPKFDATAALEAIDRHRVTWVNLVPTMMSRMLRVLEEDRDRFDLSSLRAVWHMAAPCPPWLKEAWIELLGPERLFELYGGTETISVTVISGTEWLEHRGSVGRPILGEMIVLGDDGAPLPPGEVGEIYMRRTAGTPPTYRYIGAEAKEIDGWETLGDLGWMDDDGFLYISDRRTDMIVSGGANIYPAEVEAALESHPQVLSAVVVGLPDDDLGQRTHAFVQTDGDVAERDLLAFLAERLVRYKIPRSIELVDEPLRDDAGKVRRSAMRDAAIARRAGATVPS